MKKREVKAIKKSTHALIYLVLILVGLIFVFISISHSLFFKHDDRINVVFYGQNTAFYSWGKADNINYFMTVPPDLKILIPGGYGYYRVGALGKLISLEKKPELLSRAFSSVSSSLVSFYFYPQSDAVYYGKTDNSSVFFPGFNQIWFSRSNASFFNRLYFWLAFALAKKADFATLEPYPTKSQGQETLFDETAWAKHYQGFFYNKTYRNENKTVQIIYTKDYNSAAIITRILEGVGIRVVDISQHNKQPKVCVVYEAGKSFSRTASALASFFHCHLTKGETGVFDIILELADKEVLWSRE